jgi:glucose/arabinose dehydrogenase
MIRFVKPLVLLTAVSGLQGATRVENTTVTLPDAPPSTSISVVDAFPGLSFTHPTTIASLPGDTQRLAVCQKAGSIWLIPDVTAASASKAPFLDLNGIVDGRSGEDFDGGTSFGSEDGLIGLVFHLDYQSNGYFFTVYTVQIAGDRYQRLSRWHDPNRTDTAADPGSEKVLIEMRDESGNHNGGDLHFGPDGYLYMSWGDEGSSNDFHGNSQKIDHDFWSSIIRIDVDLEVEDYTVDDGTGSDDDNLTPNNHPAVVLHGGNPLYEIPADNPFVGASTFNGQAVVPTEVRTEFYAVGLRNPWRFSFDPATGEIWCGDVGQGAREEIDVITAGGNYGWGWREGDEPAYSARHGELINGAGVADATLTEPVWDYSRGGGTYQGYSVTGGLVYRGSGSSGLAGLAGNYIFADFSSGNIWALERSGTPGAPNVQRLAGENGAASFAIDPSNGDILFADHGDNRIRRLVANDPGNTFPATLTETGLFADLATLTPHPGVIPYGVNLPFWSDHAVKSRWFVIKNTTDQFGYDPDDNWSTPPGAIWVKHMELETERGNPATAIRIETRIIVRNSGGSYGVSYRWNAAGSEAFLVSDGGDEFDLAVIEDGSPVTQTWSIPSRAACQACHNDNSSHALSLNTRQLNRDGVLGGDPGNFLTLLFDTGYLDTSPGDPGALPRHVSPADDRYSLEARVRSYLDVNCAYCHKSGGNAPGSWDGRHLLTLAQTGVIDGVAVQGTSHPDDRLVVRGQPARSVILNRVAVANGYTRMPALASNVLDQAAIELLSNWIIDELPAYQSYPEWRDANFGDPQSPEGDPANDPDQDLRTNHDEWLERTDPNDPGDFWNPGLDTSGPGAPALRYDLPNRSVTVESSPNLQEWSRWDQLEKDGIPHPPGSPRSIDLSPLGTHEFFRFTVEER